MASADVAPRILIVDGDDAGRAETHGVFARGGQKAIVAPNAEAGLRELARVNPQVLVTDLSFPGPPGKDGLWLLRRLRDEYMGARPRVIVTTSATALHTRLNDVGVDAVVLKPATPAMLTLIDDAAWQRERVRESEQLRELIRLTLLSGDPGEAFAILAKRLALVFRTLDCVVVATLGDRQIVGCAHGPIDESPDAPIWDLCQAALMAGAPVLSLEGGQPRTYVAVPIESLGGTGLGVILLIDDKPRPFGVELVDSLRALGQRLYGELAWRSVHERIALDRDRLRESSMLDPMLGVWTRAALEAALPGEVAGAQRRGEAMSIAVLNLRGLRHLNERHGHVVGDEALRHMATIARQGLRTQDRVARYGGDSLVIVLAGAQAPDARMVVERIAAEIARTPLEHGEHTISINVSAGLSPLLGDDDSGEAAIARALAGVGLAKRKREMVVVVETADVTDMVAAAPSLEPGTTLGGMYQILHEISRGAMGVVYRAEDLGLGRPVALKTLRHDLARDRNFVERFRIEAATLAAIRHEHLVQVYAFGQDGEDVYFVMELVEGEPLEDRVELAHHEGKYMPFGLIAQAILQIGDALDAMHRAGILHRDVKPANILLDRERARAVLVDVGIAKRRGTAHDPAGTPGFTAPESFVGGAETPASDAYGLAATAYTLLTGTAPFGAGGVEEILGRQQTQGPTPPRQWRPELSEEVEAVLVRALQPDPARRHAGCGEMARALAAALRALGGEAGAPPLTTDTFLPKLGTGAALPPPKPLQEQRGTRVMPGSAPAPSPGARPPTVAPVAPPPLPPPTPPVAALSPPRAASSGNMAAAVASRRSGPVPVMGAPLAQPPSRPGALREPDAPEPGVPHTRGVLFRSAYRVLGARQGAAWVSHVSRKNAALAQALQPQNTLLSWHPTELFVQMLRAIKESGRDPHAFGRELGRVAASATIGRFLGADPLAMSPGEVLASADLYWSRYHTWGVIEVQRDEGGAPAATVTVSGNPGDELLWAPTAGILEQVAMLSGAAQSQVTILDKAKVEACRFRVQWMMPRPVGGQPG